MLGADGVFCWCYVVSYLEIYFGLSLVQRLYFAHSAVSVKGGTVHARWFSDICYQPVRCCGLTPIPALHILVMEKQGQQNFSKSPFSPLPEEHWTLQLVLSLRKNLYVIRSHICKHEIIER